MTLVFDTGPLLAYAMDEASASRTETLLRRVEAGREPGHVSRVTLTELHYLLMRRQRVVADMILERLGEVLQVVECAPAAPAAARIKAAFPLLSIADAFAAATAREVRGDLVLLGDAPLEAACGREGIRVRRV